MSLQRGHIVYVAVKGPYTRKPRPAVIVQNGSLIGLRESVTLCPLTGELEDAPLFRVRIEPTKTNGLLKPSDVMTDKLVTVPKSALDENPIGALDPQEMVRVDRAIRYWLGL